jgi:hypothetical protein
MIATHDVNADAHGLLFPKLDRKTTTHVAALDTGGVRALERAAVGASHRMGWKLRIVAAPLAALGFRLALAGKHGRGLSWLEGNADQVDQPLADPPATLLWFQVSRGKTSPKA